MLPIDFAGGRLELSGFLRTENVAGFAGLWMRQDGVFYPDNRPTQRVGIVPDIVARPTIEGIRNGRDEVVEAALRHILGPGTPASEIERMARR